MPILITFIQHSIGGPQSVQISSVIQSCPTLWDPVDCNTTGLPVHHQLPKFTQTHESVMPSSHLILCLPLLLWPSILPNIRIFSMSQLFASGGQNIGVSVSTSVLPMNAQDRFPLGWTGWTPCSPEDSQESSPTPQFESINSSVLGFLYSPTVTSIHDYWKNHSLD